MTIDEEKLEALLKRASADGAKTGAEHGVRETFTSLGLDVSTPAARIEVQKDMSFVRAARRRASLIVFAMFTGMAATAGGITEGIHWLTTVGKVGKG